MELKSVYLSQSLAKELAISKIKTNFLRLFYSDNTPCLHAVLYHATLIFTLLRNCSAPYHNSEHTLNVLSCGLYLLEGWHLKMGPIKESEWASVVVSLCYHDIGYVRNICRHDDGLTQVISQSGKTIDIPPFATDAYLSPYHVERSILFAREKIVGSDFFDIELIVDCIKQTSFDVHAEGSLLTEAKTFPKIVQTADLVGQLGDLNYFNNLPLLYFEMEEIGLTDQLGIYSVGDLRSNYPKFFKDSVLKKIKDTLPLLEITKRGELSVSNLNYNLFSEDNRFKVSEETQKIMGDIIFTLESSTSPKQAYTNLLKILCEHYIFQIGHVYLLDESEQKLKSSSIWYTNNSESEEFNKFREISEKMQFIKGQGMPGEVYEGLKPKWIPNLSVMDNDYYPRANLCSQLRLRSAIGFPLIAGEKFVGVVELFSSRVVEPDENDLSFIGYLTTFVARINSRERG